MKRYLTEVELSLLELNYKLNALRSLYHETLGLPPSAQGEFDLNDYKIAQMQQTHLVRKASKMKVIPILLRM